MITFLLLILGLLLVYFEFFLPGAIMGTLGAIAIVASIVVFASEVGILWLIGLYILVVFMAVGALIKYAIWRIPRVKPDRSIYSSDAQVGYVASTFDQDAIGRVGVVLYDLKPGGYILMDGKQLPAISESGYIVQGKEVIVLRGEGDSLIVKLKEPYGHGS